jgi:hypothetical protein
MLSARRSGDRDDSHTGHRCGALAEALKSNDDAQQGNFTSQPFCFDCFLLPDSHHIGALGWRGANDCLATPVASARNGTTQDQGGGSSPSMANSATTRRTSLGRNGFSITRRPLSETNSRSVDASVSPVTKTTRAPRPGQRRSISW